MNFDALLAVVTILFSVGGAAAVIKYRQDRSDKDREQDLRSAAAARREDQDSLARRDEERDKKYGEDKERLWAAIHDAERAARAHEKESYEERLKISERFNTVTLANATMAGDLRVSTNKIDAMSKSIEGMDKKLDDIAKEVKHRENSER